MPPDIRVSEYIELGFLLRSLLWTHNSRCKWVINDINNVAEFLDKRGLAYSTNQLQAIRAKLEAIMCPSGGSLFLAVPVNLRV